MKRMTSLLLLASLTIFGACYQGDAPISLSKAEAAAVTAMRLAVLSRLLWHIDVSPPLFVFSLLMLVNHPVYRGESTIPLPANSPGMAGLFQKVTDD